MGCAPVAFHPAAALAHQFLHIAVAVYRQQRAFRRQPGHEQEAAQEQGRTEEEVWIDFVKAGHDQYLQTSELEECWDALTEREQEVTALACMGYRNYEIAEALSISHETVKTHLQNIFTKFDIRNRNELRRVLKDWRFQEWWDSHHSRG